MTKTEQYILDNYSNMGAADIAVNLNISESTVRKSIKKLKDAGHDGLIKCEQSRTKSVEVMRAFITRMQASFVTHGEGDAFKREIHRTKDELNLPSIAKLAYEVKCYMDKNHITGTYTDMIRGKVMAGRYVGIRPSDLIGQKWDRDLVFANK